MDIPISEAMSLEMRGMIHLPGLKVLWSTTDPLPTMRTRGTVAVRSLEHSDNSKVDMDTREAVVRLRMEKECVEAAALDMMNGGGFRHLPRTSNLTPDRSHAIEKLRAYRIFKERRLWRNR